MASIMAGKLASSRVLLKIFFTNPRKNTQNNHITRKILVRIFSLKTLNLSDQPFAIF